MSNDVSTYSQRNASGIAKPQKYEDRGAGAAVVPPSVPPGVPVPVPVLPAPRGRGAVPGPSSSENATLFTPLLRRPSALPGVAPARPPPPPPPPLASVPLPAAVPASKLCAESPRLIGDANSSREKGVSPYPSSPPPGLASSAAGRTDDGLGPPNPVFPPLWMLLLLLLFGSSAGRVKSCEYTTLLPTTKARKASR